MAHETIRSLKPNVTQQEALRVFASGGLGTLYWRMRSGPLRGVAEAYVPYHLYRVQYKMGGARHERLFALDAVDGSLDLFEFPRVPEESQFVALETRNCLPSAVEESRAEPLLREKVLRIIFQEGFFRLGGAPKLECTRLPRELHMPYWLGFYGTDSAVRCRVMDAVRRRIEGAKATAFFEQWLAA